MNTKNWSSDQEEILEGIRKNAIILSKEHKRLYIQIKHQLNYFRIPIIVLSSFNSVISVGLNQYLSQDYISIIVCLISLTTGLISSIELFLNIQSSMENHLNMSKEYYLLSVDIYKTLTLQAMNRATDGNTFLEEKISIYENLFEKSNIIKRKIEDALTNIKLPNGFIIQPPTPKNESDSEISV